MGYYEFCVQSGGSVGSIVVVGGIVVGALVVVGGIVVGGLGVVCVVGGIVDGPGFASGGANSHDPSPINSTSSTATYPFPLFPRWTMNWNWEKNNF